MKFVIYSGSYNIDSFGATSTIDNSILSELYNEGHDVTWIGFGDPNSKVKKIHLRRGKFFSLISKVVFKTLMIVFRSKNSRYKLNSYKTFIDYVYSDSLCLRSIKKQNLQLDEDTILICRNSMSLKTIRYFKIRKSQVVIHSQWMHPDEQNKLLQDEYKKRGIKNPILKLE
jgi:hypothetical protein